MVSFFYVATPSRRKVGMSYALSSRPDTGQLQIRLKDGFYAGIYEETEDINTILTGNTNGLILEILYYKALGGKPILEVASKQR